MYRLMLYVLIVLVLVAALFGRIGLLPFNAFYILASAAFLVALSVLANWSFARIFRAATNVESTYITALILALIINPDPPASNLVTLAVAAIAATASKYVLAFRRRHIFNPAAMAVVITSYALGHPATWWVGTPVLLPFVLIGGVLIVRKIRRLDMEVNLLPHLLRGASRVRDSRASGPGDRGEADAPPVTSPVPGLRHAH